MQKQFLSIAFLLPFILAAQPKVVRNQAIWVGYYNTTSLGNRFSVMSDVQVRTKDWVSAWSQQLVRSGLTYEINKRVAATAGFAFFRTAQSTSRDLLFKKEWRPWQELSIKLEKKKTVLTQRLRTEQRFIQQLKEDKLSNNYTFTFRMRYKWDLQVPIAKTALSFGIGNEVMVNPVAIGTPNVFDQNRASGSIFWKAAPGLSLQWQYIKIIQKKWGVDLIDNQDVVRFNVHQQLKWNSK